MARQGEFVLDLPGQKSIFQLMCERILKLKALTAAKHGTDAAKVPVCLLPPNRGTPCRGEGSVSLACRL